MGATPPEKQNKLLMICLIGPKPTYNKYKNDLDDQT
jgi:hypothetical protein